MFEIIKNEIWDRRIQLLAYCGIGIALLGMYVALFPSLQASSAQLEKLLQAYPKGFYQAFGIQDLSFSTIEKLLSVELFSFMWPILAIIFAISRAGGALAGEIEKGTMGLFLSLPVSRLRIYSSKYFGELISIIIFVVATVLSIVPLTATFNESANLSTVLKLSLLSLLFMWAVFALATFLSALFSDRSKVYMIVGGVLLLMYASNVIASLKPGLGWLHRSSIFYYYNAQDILSRGLFHFSYALVFIALIVSFTLVGGLVFSRRDIAN